MEVFHDTAPECHLPYGITQCNLPPDTSEHTGPYPSQAGWWFTDPGGTEGWVDLVDLIVPGPGVEPATFRSRVRRPTAAPRRRTHIKETIDISLWQSYWMHWVTDVYRMFVEQKTNQRCTEVDNDVENSCPFGKIKFKDVSRISRTIRRI